ncbi:hypothetical protein CC86DRAFT_12735 [Ophiobolus disseminans]|uniref:BTB domain-containing protein n=1 Tax=Ophiobolus disseminans TaxID=1469910 RepID=A0A6A7AK25_9PLEO|nr:hypothetical protein CC86DRAFT_12735 [Ophiobolus disseminans]
MFASSFSETVPDPDDGKYHITAENFDAKAMEHVMNIVHVKTKRLPQKLDLELLAHIAVLVNYYDMKDAISFHAEIWAKAAARNKFSVKYGRDVVLRTFVARAFSDATDENFKRGADFILQHSTGPVPDIGLPTLGLADMLDERRCKAIQVMLNRINHLGRDIESHKWGCSDACRAMLLGSFLMKCRALRSSGVRLNQLQQPFVGFSFHDLTQKLSDCASSFTWYSRRDGNELNHQCDLVEFVETAVKAGKVTLEKKFDDMA